MSYEALIARLEAAMSYEALIARLEAATGPDRDIDLAINDALGLDNKFERDAGYTGSLDSALSLVERKLPGWRVNAELYWNNGALWADDTFITGPLYNSDGSTPDQVSHAGTWSAPACIAILSALLKAPQP